MKYKIGDKVKYDGGDWWLFGTISAVFEHSICPCYRISVERMEKKSCKFSITQFEFELEADGDVESDKVTRKWEISEVEYLKKYYGVLNNEDLSKVLKRSTRELEQKWLAVQQDAVQAKEPATVKETAQVKEAAKTKAKEPAQVKEAVKPKDAEVVDEKAKQQEAPEKETRHRAITQAWIKNLEAFKSGEKSPILNAWKALNRSQFNSGTLSQEKLEKLNEASFPFEVPEMYRREVKLEDKSTKLEDESVKDEEKPAPKEATPKKRKMGEAWDKHFEAYQRGEKSNLISTWIANNRKQYKSGKLTEKKFEKLMKINFPFDAIKKKDSNWERQLEEWKKGERRSISIQQWRQRSIRQFLDGKLSGDRIVKLKDVGILK